jgi:hypothetical protein
VIPEDRPGELQEIVLYIMDPFKPGDEATGDSWSLLLLGQLPLPLARQGKD